MHCALCSIQQVYHMALTLVQCEYDTSQHMCWTALIIHRWYVDPAMIPYTLPGVLFNQHIALVRVLYHTCWSVWNGWMRLSSAKKKSCVLRYHHIYINTNTHRSKSLFHMHTHTLPYTSTPQNTFRHSYACDQNITFLPYISYIWERPKNEWKKTNFWFRMVYTHAHISQAITTTKPIYCFGVWIWMPRPIQPHKMRAYGKAQHTAISATMVK